MSELEDIAKIPLDGGLGKLPERVRIAVEYVANCADETCELSSGRTALFWHLVMVVGQHIKREREPQDERVSE